MDDANLSVISQLKVWLELQQTCWLCTVIDTWGSAPRRPGSLMACNDSGMVIGSLSGGCIEDDLVAELIARQFAIGQPFYKIYGETPNEVERFKLPCGGKLGILIEPFPSESSIQKATEHFKQIEYSLQQRHNIKSTRNWQTGQFNSVNSKQPPAITFKQDGSKGPISITQIYGPETHLIIIGICDVARYLAEFALTIGCRVSVCDPRPELLESWQVENTRAYSVMPDELIQQQAIDNNCAIVAVSHDPRIDDMGLMVAFETPAFFIGAMGSQRSSQRRRQRLLELGVNELQLERLRAPVGLDINSKTPAEIAIAIAAEIISCRHQHEH